MRLVFATVLLAIALPVTAEIFQYTDAQGNRVYTDLPPQNKDASSVKLPTANTVYMPATPHSSNRPDKNEAADATQPYSLLELHNLPTEEAIRSNSGSFTVAIAIEPRLANQHRLQLLIDGKPYGAASRSTHITVQNLDRGEHRLSVQVLAHQRAIQSSAEQTIAVQRVHIGSPAVRPNPAPRPAP